MNDYEAKQQARRERLEARADKARKDSTAHYERAGELAHMIPFGQPILVGHHSEKRARAHYRKIAGNMDKSVALSAKAKYYDQKAAAVGTGGISSDDPEAVAKLREQLARCESDQDKMKAANRVIRKKALTPEQKIAELVAQGFTESVAHQLLKADFCGRVGFPDYRLQNNNANIRRLRARIAELEQAAQAEPARHEFDGYEVREEDNRVQFIFPGKPAAEVRAVLKAHAFKWSPSRGAWVRMLNGNGRFAAQQVIAQLREMDI